MPFQSKTFWLLTSLLAAITLVIHFLTATNYELHRDEMLYMAMGDHLSLGYMTTPPLMGFLAFIIKTFFGHVELGVKLFPALSGAASVVIIALTVRESGGKIFATGIACIAFILAPAFLQSDSLFMPVPFDEFFWLLTAFLVIKLVNTGNERWWLVIGFVLGIAFLNKYSIAFFAFSLFVALLLSPHRKMIMSRYLCGGLLIGLALITPNLIWQVQHKFPLFSHMAELQRTQLVNESPSTFITGQLLMNLPCILIWLTGLIGILFLKRERNIQFIGISYLLVIILLLLGRGKAYYSLGAYPMLFAAGGYVLEKYFIGRARWLTYLFLLFAFVVSGLILPLSLPLLPAPQMEAYCKQSSKFIGTWPTRWEDGTIHSIPQNYADMTGWKQLSGWVTKAYNKLDAKEQQQCLIYASNYGQAAAIEYYGKPAGLPEPVSVMDAFLFWAPDSTSKSVVIYVGNKSGMLDSLFNNYEQYAEVNNRYFREQGIKIYIARNPTPAWFAYFAEGIKQKKALYQ